MAVSRKHPGVLWTHNDSGDSARVFALNGVDAPAQYSLGGVTAMDWEDMAIGPGPDPAQSYLYLGDIGDNASLRPDIVVYRLPEPDQPLESQEAVVKTFTTLRLRYPDGPHDAETLMVDPQNGDLYVVTKVITGGPSGVFRAPAGSTGDATITLEQVGEIPFGTFTPHRDIPPGSPPLPTAAGKIPTGGDISPAGDVIAIRTYGTVWIWSRAPGQSIADALAAQPCEGPSAIEPQGEAIAFDADSGGYWTASEGANVPLHHFRFR